MYCKLLVPVPYRCLFNLILFSTVAANSWCPGDGDDVTYATDVLRAYAREALPVVTSRIADDTNSLNCVDLLLMYPRGEARQLTTQSSPRKDADIETGYIPTGGGV